MRLCGWSPVYERRSEGVESCFSDCGFRNIIIRNPTPGSGRGGGVRNLSPMLECCCLIGVDFWNCTALVVFGFHGLITVKYFLPWKFHKLVCGSVNSVTLKLIRGTVYWTPTRCGHMCFKGHSQTNPRQPENHIKNSQIYENPAPRRPTDRVEWNIKV